MNSYNYAAAASTQEDDLEININMQEDGEVKQQARAPPSPTKQGSLNTLDEPVGDTIVRWDGL